MSELNEYEFAALIKHEVSKHPGWMNTAIIAATSGLQKELAEERQLRSQYGMIAMSALHSAYRNRAHKEYTELGEFKLVEACETIFPKLAYPKLWKEIEESKAE